MSGSHRPVEQAPLDYCRLLRRDVLRLGGQGLLGLNLPRWLQAAAARNPSSAPPVRAKSVIFLFQFGGPSHLDTFDMKPGAPDGIRSLYHPIPSAVPGEFVCEHLPRMARMMNKVALIRSVHHTMKNHNPASYYALTGRAPLIDDIRLPATRDLFPAYGSVVDCVAPAARGMATFVAEPYIIRDGSVTPGQGHGFLKPFHDPLLITGDPNAGTFHPPEITLPADVDADRLADRRSLLDLIGAQSRQLEQSASVAGLEASYQRAYGMINSTEVRQAFDLSQESPATRAAYGRTTYGQSCLLARRLVEAGVKFVNVYFSDSIGGQSTERGGWDTHGFNNTRMYPILNQRHLPLTDQTLPTLLADLEDRGLLESTLVVWMGEFGRTPRLNANISRDHWPQCYTALLAGGGIRGGAAYGASDEHGAHPARDPVRPDDLAATMFWLLGIDPKTEIHDHLNRPFAIAAGEPLTTLV